ncbi:heterokaryon incompatibility protein-domain-containing protein [Echria macrotheca]|uniref:Heterokaryon incompatibility protein-domain-containing protein n=1 Tax=Echria macrotheca TaxID=438768 RepID=A0AAJ0B4Y3_9PEZI|nr:heterokaryon incompatibility protein-domain-containing protein [Echria macrotheca]
MSDIIGKEAQLISSKPTFESSPTLCDFCSEVVTSTFEEAPSANRPLRWVVRSGRTCPLCDNVGHDLIAPQPQIQVLGAGCKIDELTTSADACVVGMRTMTVTEKELTQFNIPTYFSKIQFFLLEKPPVLVDPSLVHDYLKKFQTNRLVWGMRLAHSAIDSGRGPPVCLSRFEFQRQRKMKKTAVFNEDDTDWDPKTAREMLWKLTASKGDPEPIYHRAAYTVSSLPDVLAAALDPNKPFAQIRLQLAHIWLNRCQQEHSRCRKWQSGEVDLPTRVIAIEPGAAPFLYETKPGEKGRYVCLSHRWTDTVVRTTSSTLSEMMRGIPMDTLSQTFRDAIMTSRSLGFQYIWIDSLCIVQDRLDDWISEAEKMGDTYRRAALTIVASSADGGDSGCFQDWGRGNLPIEIGKVTFDVGCQDGHADHRFKLYAQRPRPPQIQRKRDTFRPRGSLDERGWILQEEVLSGRLLVFCADGIYWECLEMDAAEFCPQRREPLLNTPDLFETSMSLAFEQVHYARDFKNSVLSYERLAGDLDTAKLNGYTLRQHLYLTWRRVVENYSSRLLTKEKDRLIALHGMMKVMAPVVGDRLVAGLWEGDIVNQLLWRVDSSERLILPTCGCIPSFTPYQSALGPSRPRRRVRDTPKMPSWSWASVNQQVSYEKVGFGKALVQNISVDIQQKDFDVRGRLRLRGVMRTALTGACKPKRGETAGERRSLIDPRNLSLTDLGSFFPDEEVWADQRILCLGVAEAGYNIGCIALVPTDPSAMKRLEFRRVGLAIWGKEAWASFISSGSGCQPVTITIL